MNKKERALFIETKLNELFPRPKAPLNHSNAFTLLIAVLLSAQTTDKRVNIVTKELFKKAKTAKDMYKLGEQNVYQCIKTCGLAPKKAKAKIAKKILKTKAPITPQRIICFLFLGTKFEAIDPTITALSAVKIIVIKIILVKIISSAIKIG